MTAVNKIAEQFGTVVMVGDRVNDAPTLATASVGIVGVAGSDVALRTDDMSKRSFLIRLSRRTVTVIRQDIASKPNYTDKRMMRG